MRNSRSLWVRLVGLIEPSGQDIAILSSQGDTLPGATESYGQGRIAPGIRGSRSSAPGTEGLDLTFVRLVPKDAGPISEIALTGVRELMPNAVLRKPDGGVTVRTEVRPWTYAASLPIPAEALTRWSGCSAIVKISVQVTASPVGLGVLRSGMERYSLARKEALPSANVDVVELNIPKLSDAGDILVQAWEGGKEGLSTISSVSLRPYACPAER